MLFISIMKKLTQTSFFNIVSENTELLHDKHELFLHYDDFAKRLSAFYRDESSPLENISTTNLILVELYILRDKAIEVLFKKKV